MFFKMQSDKFKSTSASPSDTPRSQSTILDSPSAREENSKGLSTLANRILKLKIAISSLDGDLFHDTFCIDEDKTFQIVVPKN